MPVRGLVEQVGRRMVDRKRVDRRTIDRNLRRDKVVLRKNDLRKVVLRKIDLRRVALRKDCRLAARHALAGCKLDRRVRGRQDTREMGMILD